MNAHARHIPIETEGVGPALPLVVIQAERPGPTVVVTANLHGDEITGLAAAHRLADRLPGELKAGSVLLYPSLNPAGLAAGTRGLPADGGDLNRVFPGRRRGKASERLADVVWREVTGRDPAVVIDLHADSAASVPYCLLDRPVGLAGVERAHMAATLEQIGVATGLTVVQDYPADLYLRYALDRSLAGALVNKARIPAVTLEAGPRRRIDPPAVDAVVSAIYGVLALFSMVDVEVVPHPSRVPGGPWRRAPGPRVGQDGWLDAEVAAGQPFRAGARLGWLRGLDGRLLEKVVADQDGVVLSWVESPWATAGSVVGTWAVAEGQ
jgi:hypothetical protein